MKMAYGYFPGMLLTFLLFLGGIATVNAQEVTSAQRPGVSNMLARVTPAVVNIAVTGRAAQAQNPLLNDPMFRRFFDIPEQQPQARQRTSVGSGVIIDAEQGHILTNHHVVANAEQIEVTLQDRRQVSAELVGSDPNTDIALLRIDAQTLHEIPLSDSDTLKVGDFVAAIGNPFGIGQTVTTGIVSALGRGTGIIADGNGYEDFIQTDASINPGNSGGALVDYNGNLVGINTAIIAPSGGNVGIGFSVPINMATAIVTQLLEFGEVSRGLLGVMIQDLTPDLAQVMGLGVDAGAVISQVQADSAAEKAGLEPGDVIIAVNNRPVDSSRDLRNTIGLLRPGESVDISLLREGDERHFNVIIGEASQVASIPENVTESSVLQGAELSSIPSSDPRFGKIEGVFVTQVEQGSRAWNNGLRTEDIILEVNRQAVSSPQQLLSVMGSSSTTAALRVMRGEQVMFLVMR